MISGRNLVDRDVPVGPGALAGAAVSFSESNVAAAALGCRNKIPARLHSALALFFATLREIFDESAYRRFLQRHHQQPSRASYAAFLRDHSRSGARPPRCC